MKPFNLEAAKRGDEVVTDWGLPVKIIEFDLISDYPILGIIYVDGYETKHKFSLNGKGVIFDILMKSKKEVVYVNIYRGGTIIGHTTKENALKHAEHGVIATAVKLEYET